jgi:hypothetical protein
VCVEIQNVLGKEESKHGTPIKREQLLITFWELRKEYQRSSKLLTKKKFYNVSKLEMFHDVSDFEKALTWITQTKA